MMKKALSLALFVILAACDIALDKGQADSVGSDSGLSDEGSTLDQAEIEPCDGIDNEDDDDVVDGTLVYYDADGDGFGGTERELIRCNEEASEGYVNDAGDCKDDDAEIYPGNGC